MNHVAELLTSQDVAKPLFAEQILTGYVIFTYDKNSDIHMGARFYRHIDTLRAMGKLKGKIIKTFGMYDGVIEDSFIAHREDFYNHILNSGYVNEQESFLMVPEDQRQPVWLEYQRSGVTEMLGRMKSSTEMPMTLGWTYRPDLKLYFYV